MSKFKPQNHIIGKVYDLTQENMTLMIKEIEKLNEDLDAALLSFYILKKDSQNLKEKLLEVLTEISKESTVTVTEWLDDYSRLEKTSPTKAATLAIKALETLDAEKIRKISKN